MKSFIHKVIIQPIGDAWQRMQAFLPNLLTALVVLLIGFFLAWIVKLFVVRLFRWLKLDRAFAKAGIPEALQKMTVKDTPAKLVGRMFYWLVVIIFFVLALVVLKVPLVDELLQKLLLYLPNIFAAGLIVAIGYFLAHFLGRAVLIASVNAGLRTASFLSKGVKTVVMLFASVMALEQLGIGRSTVVATFAIVFGGGVLALALAFGLGGRDVARTFLEKQFKKDRPPDDKPDEFKHL
jgi:small-conductance mechanosensitive channel